VMMMMMIIIIIPYHSFPLQAKGIIHLGATSCFVGDNTDVVQIKEAMILIKRKVIKLIAQLKKFACES